MGCVCVCVCAFLVHVRLLLQRCNLSFVVSDQLGQVPHRVDLRGAVKTTGTLSRGIKQSFADGFGPCPPAGRSQA